MCLCLVDSCCLFVTKPNDARLSKHYLRDQLSSFSTLFISGSPNCHERICGCVINVSCAYKVPHDTTDEMVGMETFGCVVRGNANPLDRGKFRTFEVFRLLKTELLNETQAAFCQRTGVNVQVGPQCLPDSEN